MPRAKGRKNHSSGCKQHIRPWQQTQADYLKQCRDRYAAAIAIEGTHQQLCAVALQVLRINHRAEVLIAITHGEYVAFEILKEYPGIVEEARAITGDENTVSLMMGGTKVMRLGTRLHEQYVPDEWDAFDLAD